MLINDVTFHVLIKRALFILSSYCPRKFGQLLFVLMNHWYEISKDSCEPKNRLIKAKCVASVTNCGLGLETAMAPTVNKGWQLFTNGKYWKSLSKLFHITLM
jgi:hypothetical protein